MVYFEETPQQLIGCTRALIAAQSGRLECYGYEYRCNGKRDLFVFCDPKGGYRHIAVARRRTYVDFADQMKWLVDETYPYMVCRLRL